MNQLQKITLHTGVGPFYHDGVETPVIMYRVLLALAPATVCGSVLFGLHTVLLILTCCLSAVGFEYMFGLSVGRKSRLSDGSALVVGLLMALNLPPTTPYFIGIFGSGIAVIVMKELFGGLGCNLFNPVLSSRIILMLFFPKALSTFIAPLNPFTGWDAVSSATPLTIIKTQGASALLGDGGEIWGVIQSLLIGNHSGSIGETSVLAIAIGAAFLLFKRVISWHIPVAMYASVAIVAFAVYHDPAMVIIHLLSGGLAIGAFFMATDYVTAPVYPTGKIIFGAGCGALLMVIRLWGSYPEGCMFAICMMNIFTPLIDRLTMPRPFGVNKSLRFSGNF